ncbi:hypothetical protein Tco_0553748 [Tanacetum coccineum]
MPRATVGDTSLTRSYIPEVSQTPGISPTIAHFYKPIEDRCIHEGRVVDQLYYTSDHIDRSEQQYNLAYFFVKRIESTRATPKAHLPYGMFLTRLFRHVMEHYPHLDNGIYNAVDRVMRPLALKQTRKNPEVIVEKPVTPSHQLPPIITVDLHLAKNMMMRMMVLLMLVPHLLPPT